MPTKLHRTEVPRRPARALLLLPALLGALLAAGCGGIVVADQVASLEVRVSMGAREAAPRAVSESPEAACPHAADPYLLPLGGPTIVGGPVRLIAVSERPLGRARLLDQEGRSLRATPLSTTAPPYALLFEGQASARPGTLRFRLSGSDTRSVTTLACAQVEVRSSSARPQAPPTGVWLASRSWDEGWEMTYSAWVAWLFRWQPGQPEAWRPLQKVFRNPSRNFLHDALGLGEDSGGATAGGATAGGAQAAGRSATGQPRVIAWADCGDVPYQLRAYFAWKHRLPFRYRRCTRGNGLGGPACPIARDHGTADFDRVSDPVLRFNAFLREGLAWQVHSGTTRTLPEDEGSDFFPIRLARDTIRPGTIFVDVGGHVIVVTQWDAGGLYGVDGHPDFSVTRKGYSEKDFRFFRGTRTGGFKAFRPLRMVDGVLQPLPNRAVSTSFSVEQYRYPTGREFHRAMARMLASLPPG